jgi:hypothetical protein
MDSAIWTFPYVTWYSSDFFVYLVLRFGLFFGSVIFFGGLHRLDSQGFDTQRFNEIHIDSIPS